MSPALALAAHGTKRFDHAYDPMVAADPGRNRAYAPTYWITTAGDPPPDDGPVVGDIDADVAIVGSGYTGLSAALHLAREHGVKAHVLEANGVAWGCSTRNGGQAQISSGRLKRSDWIKRWGVDTAKSLHNEMVDGFALFRDLIKSDDFDCEPQDTGHLFIAHKPSVMPKLRAESELLNSTFGYRARIIDQAELRRDYVNESEAAGAMYEPDGVGVHAAKLAFSYLRAVRRLGGRVHPASPVTGWSQEGNWQVLQTPGGRVRAKRVGVATAGYTSRSLHPLLKNRIMPILSNSIVTRKLTDAEREACNFRSTIFYTDTRTLRHYYRMLPDGRVQIGSRSAITGADASNPRHEAALRDALVRKFPVLADIAIDFSWWGWVDVSHDMMPRIFQPDPGVGIFYALGYGGNGVMYSAQAGRRLAQLIAGQKDRAFDLPIFSSPLPHHGPLTPFRRLGQRLAYHWYWFQDEKP